MDDIMKICKNYKIITNCEFLEDDIFSNLLVEYYKNKVKNTPVDNEIKVNQLIKFDKVMRKYIEDYRFSKKLKNSVDVTSIVNSKIDLSDAVVDYVSSFFDKYDVTLDESIVNTRWI